MCYSKIQYDNRIKKLVSLEAQKKELEEQIAAIRADIQTDMGDNEKVETDRFKILWTVFSSVRLDSKALKADLPEIFDRYSRENTSRRFSYSAK